MPKKPVKQIIKQTFELPVEAAKKAVEPTKATPLVEEEGPVLSDEALEKKKKEDKAAAMARVKKIEEEIAELSKKRREEMRARRMETEEPEEEKKPLVEPPAKRPRKFLAGLKRQREQSRPELAGRRVSG